MKASSEEQRVANEVVVKVVVDKVPQLAGDVPGRQSHDGRTRAGKEDEKGGSEMEGESVL